MKLFAQLLLLGVAADLTVASNWFSKAGMLLFSFRDAFVPIGTDFSRVLAVSIPAISPES